jgi:hypothetical protein
MLSAAALCFPPNDFASSSLAEVQAEKVHYKNVLRKVRKSVPFEIEVSDDEDTTNDEDPAIGSGKRR